MSRLIDADALIEGYRHMGYDPTEHPEESYMEGWCKGFNAAVDHCTHHVIHAPAIEERKKGKWNGTQNVECDQCGHLYPAFMRLEKYCPNCGVRMEVGHE